MQNLNALPFLWDENRTIDISNFRAMIDKAYFDKQIEESCKRRATEHNENDFVWPEETEEENEADCLRHSRNANADQIKLAWLSREYPEVKTNFEQLWNDLESKGELKFLNSKLRSIGVRKCGLDGFRSHSYENYIENINEEILMHYLSNDLHFLTAASVIEYIKYKQSIEDTAFLGRLTDLIKPLGMGQGGKKPNMPGYLADWIYAHVAYMPTEKKEMIYKKLEEHLVKTNSHSFKIDAIKKWYRIRNETFKKYLASQEVISIINACLIPHGR